MKKSREKLITNLSDLCNSERFQEQFQERRRKMLDDLHERELARFHNLQLQAFLKQQESSSPIEAITERSKHPDSTNKPVLIPEKDFYQIIGRGEASAAANGMWFKRRRDMIIETGNESLLPPYKQIGRKRFYPADKLDEWLRSTEDFE